MTDWDGLRPKFLQTLLTGDDAGAVALAQEALGSGATPVEFFDKAIAPSLTEIGRRFQVLEVFLPEMVTAADVVERVNVQVINPAVESSGVGRSTKLGKVLLATVQGDLHDIGKNMVALMLRVTGFEVIDLGVDVSPSDIVSRAEKEKVEIIGLSSLLTTCLPYIKDVNDHLEGKGIRQQFSVIIGGAATSPDLAAQVGANAHGASAADGAEKCKMLLAQS